jgi:hypothetical protein
MVDGPSIARSGVVEQDRVTGEYQTAAVLIGVDVGDREVADALVLGVGASEA